MGEIFQSFLGQSFVFVICQLVMHFSFLEGGSRMFAFKYFLDVRNFLFWVLESTIFSLDVIFNFFRLALTDLPLLKIINDRDGSSNSFKTKIVGLYVSLYSHSKSSRCSIPDAGLKAMLLFLYFISPVQLKELVGEF